MNEEISLRVLLWSTTALACIIWGMPATAQTQFQNNLMPQPSMMIVGNGSLSLNSTFAVEIPKVNDARLTDAIGRAVRHIEMTAGLRHAGG